MSGLSAEQYHPGLEGVIASETAIANIEGRDGAGGLEYRGYRIEEMAGRVSYEETAFLLLHGDLLQPRRPAPPRVRWATPHVAGDSGDALIRAEKSRRRFPHQIHPNGRARGRSVSVLYPHFDPGRQRAMKPTTQPTYARPSAW